ncbi:ABC transporter ATP-binding protein (plasmid) [Agrobacterium pusense]|uniref:ABC transporter ATP-binding protein n=1 Tax=Agrobacterium pusense TaxID=648995 RepID=A0A6H0ZFS5_9HYPH|nr:MULTISPECIES: ABC transporter ATP-binding protein [Agrobacterium]PZP70907.1 MAG: ABC transporter ATP-binding protein [Delftia acidovorans]QCM08356.1 ABC transporter ATP-binding protein [Agrobacterium tumefaciens]THD29931.1 MAG: ABC transporter ATP-binding protein [Flavobacterium johnsoniae]CUX65630.1 putative branched-chain amino acid transport system ATP-binding protein [Agrobacterium genomosp. 5 str. CFBP 6626]MDH0117835.1 ABC transporter ATP-binding protein [Agrobacterium pusense]
MADDAILRAENLRMEFRGFHAVDSVNIAIKRGSIHALIGPNGAGKTTCFNLLTKFLTPTEGTIVFDGEDVTSKSPSAIARLGMIRSFQISAVFPTMTVTENIVVALQRARGQSLDFWRSDAVLRSLVPRAMALAEEVGLERFASTPAGELSYGRKRALEIATTLALDPKLMLLDEPMAGMAVEDIDRIVELIRRVAVGRTVLMVEHNLKVVSTLSDKITVLARGKVLAEGNYASVSSDPRVLEAYLGASHG